MKEVVIFLLNLHIKMIQNLQRKIMNIKRLKSMLMTATTQN